MKLTRLQNVAEKRYGDFLVAETQPGSSYGEACQLCGDSMQLFVETSPSIWTPGDAPRSMDEVSEFYGDVRRRTAGDDGWTAGTMHVACAVDPRWSDFEILNEDAPIDGVPS